MTSLKNKVVAITGAARGMGRAYVQGFLAEGARVVALDRSWEPTGLSGDEDDAFRRELQARKDVLVATADISDAEQVQDSHEQAQRKFGVVDILINNAGLRQRDLFQGGGRTVTLAVSDANFERMYAVNVFGTLKVTRAFTKGMIEQRSGSVVSVITSGALMGSNGGAYTALRPNSREQPYTSSKAALASMMFYIADELKEHNVAVNVVVPGHTRTTGFVEQNAARAAAGRPTGPMPLKPEHIVPLVLFLAQQEGQHGATGRAFDTVTWNLEHGLGGPEQWAAPNWNE